VGVQPAAATFQPSEPSSRNTAPPWASVTRGARHVYVCLGGRTALRKLHPQHRLLAGRLLLLLALARGLFAQLRARGLAVPLLESGVKALRHGGGIGRPVRGSAPRDGEGEEGAEREDGRDRHDRGHHRAEGDHLH